MLMPTVYLIRHAEAEPYWNQGDSSRPLTERGRRQAQWMAQHLSGIKVDDFRCAPHQRCVETAEIIGRALNAEPELDDRLHIARSFEVELSGDISIWIAHSNNIPDAIYALGAPANRCGHASAWKLTLTHEGQLKSAEYIEPDV